MRNIFTNTRNFPDSQAFAANQHTADTLVINTIPGKYSELKRTREELESIQYQKQECLTTNATFLNDSGFTPSYLTERKSRAMILRFTPVFSGLSIATGLNIIFGMDILLAICLGLSLSILSFFLALNDKVLENSSNKKELTYLLFLAIDAVVLIVGLVIGLSNSIPNEYMAVHVMLCLFAVALNFSMLKHADKYNEDKIRERIKTLFLEIKDKEEKTMAKLETIRQELFKLFSELGAKAVALREGFVAHNYNPSTIRMSEETRMVLNQYFGYDLFPIVGDMILQPDAVWNRRQITKWASESTSIYPEIMPVFGHFSSNTRFVLDQPVNEPPLRPLSESNQTSDTRTNSNGASANNSHSNDTMDNVDPSVFQTPESETEL